MPTSDPKMSTGSNPKMSTGSNPKMSTGSNPKMSTGSNPNMSTGSNPKMSTGSNPKMSTGSNLKMSAGDPSMSAANPSMSAAIPAMSTANAKMSAALSTVKPVLSITNVADDGQQQDSMSLDDYDPPLFQPPEGSEFEQLVESEDKEYVDAKAYLLQDSTITGHNLYDHLSNVLMRILDERPCNVIDIFEELSKQEKRNKFTLRESNVIDRADKTTEVALAEIQRRLFSRRSVGGAGEEEEGPEEEEEEELEDDEESPLPDLMKLAYHFEQAGVGLTREEMVRIELALKTLVQAHSFSTVRFWGKIFGIQQNYLVAEVLFADGDDDEEEEAEEEHDADANADEAEEKLDEEEEEDEVEQEEVVPPPTINYKSPPVVEKEEKGTGVNKMTYYVCVEPGKPWVKLPTITPAHISIARKIKKFFTGKLDSPINSYPPFDGLESHYLRAQIARISAGTQISPLGFYMFDEEEEEPEEGQIREGFMPNEEWEPIGVRELADPEMENWVHHTLHILPQGRVRWWNPKQEAGEDEEEPEEPDEEKEEPEEAEPEVGPPLLTPLSEDAEVHGQPAWTARLSSRLVPKYSVAVVRSCLWPGAHAFAVGKTFENLYIGWGHKYSPDTFTPDLPLEVQTEYPSGPDIKEAQDPSASEEAAAQAHLDEEEEEEEGEDDEDEEGGDDEDEPE